MYIPHLGGGGVLYDFKNEASCKPNIYLFTYGMECKNCFARSTVAGVRYNNNFPYKNTSNCCKCQ